MVYKKIILDDTQLNSLPRDIQDIIKYENNYTLAALEEDEIVSFSVVKYIPDEMMHQICYIHYVKRDDIRSIIKQLIEAVEADCISEDEDELSVCLVGHTADLELIFSVLDELSYSNLNIDTRLLVYRLSELKKTTFFDKTSHSNLIRDNISFYNELDKRQLGAFFEKCKKAGKVVNLKKADILFTRYYLIDNEIKGFIEFSESAQGVITMQDSFIEKNEKTKYAFPVMLASALVLSNNFMPDDTIVRLYLEHNHMYKALITVFGEPDIDSHIHLLTKEL